MTDGGPDTAGAVPDAPPGNLVDRFAPPVWRPYLRLARIDRPVGWWLLLLPCWWSAALAGIAADAAPRVDHMILFLVGAVAMRGAGCVYNDIIDRDLDKQVARTRNRPLASGALSVKAALAFLVLLCLAGLAVLLSLNGFAIALGFASLLPVAVYPFMKRVTSWPQAVLGLAFAWGGLMGWAAVFGRIDPPALALYVGAVLWTVAYDTIYAVQDIEDDAVAGIRSTTRLFGERTKAAVGLFFGLALLAIGVALAGVEAGPAAWIGFGLFAAHLARQTLSIDLRDPTGALRLFRSNRDAGLVLFAGLALDAVLGA